MQQYACPNCGAPISFFSSVSVYSTCTSCRSQVIRHDLDIEKMGTVGELLNDMSPFQIGTTGTYEGRNFKLLGRVKVVYKGGSWSEWFALFDDGKIGWLAEAQGLYMMSFRVENAKFAVPKVLKPLQRWHILGELFTVEDARHVTAVASEGELPFSFRPNAKGISVDVRDESGGFATVSTYNNDLEFFKGKYVEFDAFNFNNLRQIDGW